jgi:hypothetical protein
MPEAKKSVNRKKNLDKITKFLKIIRIDLTSLLDLLPPIEKWESSEALAIFVHIAENLSKNMTHNSLEDIIRQTMRDVCLYNSAFVTRLAEYADVISAQQLKQAKFSADVMGTPYNFLLALRTAAGQDNLFLKAAVKIQNKTGSINQQSALASVIKSHRTTFGEMASLFGKRTRTDKKVVISFAKQEKAEELTVSSNKKL